MVNSLQNPAIFSVSEVAGARCGAAEFLLREFHGAMENGHGNHGTNRDLSWDKYNMRNRGLVGYE
jgi:hypothetical protein